MTRKLLAMALPALLLAACAGGTPTAGSSPTPSSSAPSTKPSATAGASVVTLKVDGVPVTLKNPVTFSNTDVVGKRLRIGAIAGAMTGVAPGEGGVSFLFGGGGVTMYPGWDVEPAQTVASIEVYCLPVGSFAAKSLYINKDTTLTTRSLVAADGHIKGTLIGDVTIPSGSASQPSTKAAVDLTFDLVQPPL